MKYKVGDIVCIKSMFEIGTIIDSRGKVGNLPFKVAMNSYCCSRLTVEEVDNVNGTYKMKEDPWHLYNDDMIERLVEEEVDLIPKFGEYSDSERIYNEEYSTGEYCHEQSFKWGFQEGFEYAMKLIKGE